MLIICTCIQLQHQQLPVGSAYALLHITTLQDFSAGMGGGGVYPWVSLYSEFYNIFIVEKCYVILSTQN